MSPNMEFLSIFCCPSAFFVAFSARKVVSSKLSLCFAWAVRPCIPNFNSNFRVGFWVGMSFSRFLKFEFDVIFSMFLESLEFSIFWNFRFFPKIFQTSTAEYFRNSQKQNVWKIPSNAGPYWADCLVQLLI